MVNNRLTCEERHCIIYINSSVFEMLEALGSKLYDLRVQTNNFRITNVYLLQGQSNDNSCRHQQIDRYI